MKEEILTAKEWLEKEEIKNEFIKVKNECAEVLTYESIDGVIEQYANYKNRILEDRIKEFSKRLKTASFYESSEGQEAEYWLREYDKHFNINKETI